MRTIESENDLRIRLLKLNSPGLGETQDRNRTEKRSAMYQLELPVCRKTL